MNTQARTLRPIEGRPRCSAPCGLRGFAMMDVVLGAAILGIVVVGTMQIFEFGHRQILMRAQERSAQDHAQNRIEEVIADGYADAVARVDTGLVVYGGYTATRTTTVTFIDDPADGLGADDPDGTEDFKEVQVEVTYGDGKSVTLKTTVVP